MPGPNAGTARADHRRLQNVCNLFALCKIISYRPPSCSFSFLLLTFPSSLRERRGREEKGGRRIPCAAAGRPKGPPGWPQRRLPLLSPLREERGKDGRGAPVRESGGLRARQAGRRGGCPCLRPGREGEGGRRSSCARVGRPKGSPGWPQGRLPLPSPLRGGGGGRRRRRVERTEDIFVQSARKAVFGAHHAMNTKESDLRRKASNQICETEKCK